MPSEQVTRQGLYNILIGKTKQRTFHGHTVHLDIHYGLKTAYICIINIADRLSSSSYF